MNTEHLRKSLKAHWLTYYRDNREWLTRLGVWVTCEGTRRPSSSFILAALSTLEPQLVQLFPLIVDLSSNPDRIVMALGLNFNPDEELEWLAQEEQAAALNGHLKMLPSGSNALEMSTPSVQSVAIRHSEVEVMEPSVHEPVQVSRPAQAQSTQAQSTQLQPNQDQASQAQFPQRDDYSPFDSSEIDTPEINASAIHTPELATSNVAAPEVTVTDVDVPLPEANSVEQPSEQSSLKDKDASKDAAQTDRPPVSPTKTRTKPKGFRPDPNYSKPVADPLARPASVKNTPIRKDPPLKDIPPTRPSMDSAQLAAGEFPKREVTEADEACEGVRSSPNSAVRGSRWD